MKSPARIVLFDTGGTVLDWHGSIVEDLVSLPAWADVRFDPHEFVNEVAPAHDARHRRPGSTRFPHGRRAPVQTAFVRRPNEWGPAGPPDPNPNRAYDRVVGGFDELVERLLTPSA